MTSLLIIGITFLALLQLMQGVTLIRGSVRKHWSTPPPADADLGVAVEPSPRERAHEILTGTLTVTIGLMVLYNCLLWATHVLIVIPDTGLAMVHGYRHCALRVLLLGYALEALLITLSAQSAHGRRSIAWWYAGLAAAVGLFAAFHEVRRVGSAGDAAAQVWAYNLYSPPMMVLMTSSLLEWILALLGQHSLRVRAGVNLGLWMLVSSACLLLISPDSAHLILTVGATYYKEPQVLHDQWSIAFVLSLGSCAGLLAGCAVAYKLKDAPKWVFILGSIAGALLVALPASIALVLHRQIFASSAVAWGGFAFSALGLVSALAICIVQSVKRTGRGAAAAYASWWLKTALLVPMFLLAGFSVDLYFTKFLWEEVDLIGSAVMALIWIEFVSEGPDCRAPLAKALWGTHSVVRATFLDWRETYTDIVGMVRGSFSWAVGASGWFWNAVRVYVFLVCLGFLSECGRRGQTVIHAFEMPAQSDGLGQRFAGVVHCEMNKLVDLLRTEVLYGTRAEGAAVGVNPLSSLRLSPMLNDGLDSTVHADAVEVPGGKIPVALIASLVLRPAQWLLWGREIQGTVERRTSVKGAETVEFIAHASSGESWRATYTNLDAAQRTELAPLAQELAFYIISTGPTWAGQGMTRDWQAFQSFAEATEQQRRHVDGSLDEKLVALSRAIDGFREAVRLDPDFAVARYRLAVALQEDSQYDMALHELRQAMDSSEQLGPAQNAYARLLFRALAYRRPYIVSAADHAPDPIAARSTWEQMLKGEEKRGARTLVASAHLGLCDSALATNSEEPGRAETLLSGLYHCARADRLFGAMLGHPEEGEGMPELRAAALTGLGEIVITLQQVRVDPKTNLPALPDQERELGCNPYWTVGRETLRWQLPALRASQPALPFFKLAAALSPKGWWNQCRVAETEQLRGNHGPMRQLIGQPTHKADVCKILSYSRARSSDSADHRFALAACDAAIETDELNTDLLNEYAYGYRAWRAHVPALDEAELRDHAIADKAEKYARRAVFLTQKRDKAPSYLAIVESTLGEVLLARGRPREAIPHLESAWDHAANHPATNEIKWDLIEAYVCATRDPYSHDVSKQRRQWEQMYVKDLRSQIDESEATREDRPLQDKARGHPLDIACSQYYGERSANEDTALTTGYRP